MIKINNIELKNTSDYKLVVTKPSLDFEPIIEFDEFSITGKKHKVFVKTQCKPAYGTYQTVKFRQKFKFEVISLDYDLYMKLNALDGQNITVIFERDTYTESYKGNLNMTFFKYNNHIWFDAVLIEITVTEEL